MHIPRKKEKRVDLPNFFLVSSTFFLLMFADVSKDSQHAVLLQNKVIF